MTLEEINFVELIKGLKRVLPKCKRTTLSFNMIATGIDKVCRYHNWSFPKPELTKDIIDSLVELEVFKKSEGCSSGYNSNGWWMKNCSDYWWVN